MASVEERAAQIITAANAWLATVSPAHRFATREWDAPYLHALVNAVAQELQVLDERVRACEVKLRALGRCA